MAKKRDKPRPPTRPAGGRGENTPSHLRKLWPVAAVIALLLLAVLWGLNHHRRAASVEAENSYVDPAVCISCHQDVEQTFSHTGMGRSIQSPSAAGVIEDYQHKNTLYNQRSDTWYTMVERDGSFYQRRHQVGPDGKEANVLEERVDYVIGSGDQARSYLHRDADGRIIQLPVSWYSEEGGHWAMTPGYDQRDQEDFHGAISYDCIFCHDAYPRPAVSRDILESGEPIFEKPLPEGIDCQRCHGPGKAHVDAARSDKSTILQVRSAIVNPARLSRQRQMEVCMECHLSTSGSQGENVSRRYDRGIFSYIPGRPLSDYKLYFDRADNEQHKNDFKVADAAYRLVFSACYRKSGMTCLTCHNPHVEKQGPAAIPGYTKICESCHQSVKHTVALPAGQNCISCHMPQRRGQYAVNIVLTDHYIQRERPQGDLTAHLQEPEEGAQPAEKLALFYPSSLPKTPKNALYLAAAQVESNPGNADNIHALRTAIGQDKTAPAEILAALGNAYAADGNASEAEQWLEQARSRKPASRPIVKELAEVLFTEGKYQRAAEVLQQVSSTPPFDSALLADLGNAYARQGMLDQAQAALERSIAINPETAQAYNLLGLISIQRGDDAKAGGYFREALLYQPGLAEADDNLGKLQMGNQDFTGAEYDLKRAIASDPKDADSHHSYGLLLMLKNAYGPAADQMRQAIALNPGDALTFSDLGDALAAGRQYAASEQAYRAALQRDPNLAQANLGLGTLLHQTGDDADAQKYCRLASASSDPSIRSAAQQCMH
ncbi:tetratricopeptide repeat protein [Paracidobacterium acidisoli]|uniref:Tetratricopeptide repeat protein n=1 Tax=Paracidobacterium acidisoli TaxID=2303751 RepID=A0A372IUL2_9BACT|nr:tetratricopeptide repeat protein [Paracidobacterium acidisoli]MBT9330094.1 tetratricopeptide repeat protein [Paracidobacterium acidisoli]